MISNQLYFQGRDDVLRRIIRKRDTSRLLYEFHDGFCGGHFTGQILQKRFCKHVTIGPPFSRMPMIIVGVVMYVKPMHKGLL
jgi:hypothetical protein